MYYITTHCSKDADHKEIDDEGDKESNAWERKEICYYVAKDDTSYIAYNL